MEFLLENPFILVVLIGIISSLFSKAKRGGSSGPVQQPGNVEPEPGPYTDAGYEQEEKAAVPVQEAGRQARESMEAYYQERKEQAEERAKRLSERQNLLESRVQNARSAAGNPEKSKSAEPAGRAAVSREKLADAIVWAEILGPPRSKNPRWLHRR
ncbi:hypothetical protein [Bacillus infantis]|uniref:hypothetical protein n=1 Tax=Bacillus infantis TaxID=324767 RepID=UPI002155C2C1|nr:hypothetical protein [Bacillus infantis]MCR6612034.1 hypothetical protein [Bacillus infantis]